MTYIEWIESLGDDCDDISPLLAWTEGHKAGRDAELERIKGIVQGLITQSDSWIHFPWIHFSTLLEKIDASEDS